jgi:hypothetical protein
MTGAGVEEALAFVQRVPTTAGGSLYEQLTHLVAKVRGICDSSRRFPPAG